MTTSEGSGRDVKERPFPFVRVEVESLGMGTRFHSGAEADVSSFLKLDWASFSALYQDCLRLPDTMSKYTPNKISRKNAPRTVRHMHEWG